MSALSKIPPPAMALLAVAGLWWLSQRRASAAPGQVAQRPYPVYGSEAALQNPAVRAYQVPVSGVLPVAQSSPLQALLAAGAQLFTGGRSVSPVAVQNAVGQYASGGPSMGYYGSPNNPSYVSEGQIIRVPGYEPGFVPDSAGEAEAQAYILQNPDAFLSTPPPTYIFNSGTDAYSGYLDNQ